MERITARQNAVIRRFRDLGRDPAQRRQDRTYLCDGEKLLEEALRSEAEILCVMWKGKRGDFPPFSKEYLLAEELYDYVSPMKNSPGPLFSVRMMEERAGAVHNALILEGVQDPGNVGTVIRTADAFGIDVVILLEQCADLYGPKTVRSAMGALFRQRVLQMEREALPEFCRRNGLTLYAAALSENAVDLRDISLADSAVAVGSEGRGLSRELKNLCDRELIIPMRGEAESLNAAVAASLIMWEMQR